MSMSMSMSVSVSMFMFMFMFMFLFESINAQHGHVFHQIEMNQIINGHRNRNEYGHYELPHNPAVIKHDNDMYGRRALELIDREIADRYKNSKLNLKEIFQIEGIKNIDIRNHVIDSGLNLELKISRDLKVLNEKKIELQNLKDNYVKKQKEQIIEFGNLIFPNHYEMLLKITQETKTKTKIKTKNKTFLNYPFIVYRETAITISKTFSIDKEQQETYVKDTLLNYKSFVEYVAKRSFENYVENFLLSDEKTFILTEMGGRDTELYRDYITYVEGNNVPFKHSIDIMFSDGLSHFKYINSIFDSNSASEFISNVFSPLNENRKILKEKFDKQIDNTSSNPAMRALKTIDNIFTEIFESSVNEPLHITKNKIEAVFGMPLSKYETFDERVKKHLNTKH